MKKLLISIVATASLALVAKADVLNSASFENYLAEKFSVDLDDGGAESGDKYWSGGGTDPEFEWVTRGEGEGASNALSIDVEEELVRKVKTDGTALDIGDGLYFDSMVQFTATEEAPVPTDGDKLIVWLKEIAGEGESATPTYKLCVTAAELNAEAEPTAKVFETSAQIAPETWNRLSIAAKVVKVGESNITEFKVYVNSTLLETGAPLYSLVPYTTEADDNGYYNRITSVSFKGKGAIDDLVWTTKDPLYVPPTTTDVALNFTYADGLIVSGDDANVFWYYNGNNDLVSENGAASVTLEIGSEVVFACETPVGYTVDGFTKESEDKEVIRWTSQKYTVPAEGLELAFEITKDAPAAPKPFTVNGEAYETLAEAIDNANGATITLTENIEPTKSFVITTTVTIDLNGRTIKANDTDASTDGNGVFWVKEGGVLTLLDSSKAQTGTVDGNGGNGYKMAVWADGGRVVINGGTYKNLNSEGDDQYDLIYVKNGGEVVINGGTFICQTPRWTLNSHNSLAGTFVVKGGMFYDYDPSKIKTDEPNVTSWCDANYVATKDENDYYTVVRGYAVTVEATNATVTGLATKYAEGATVSFTVKPAEDYEVTGVTMNETPLTADNDGTYSFEMPATAVTIVVTTEETYEKPTAGDSELEADDFADPATVNSTTEVTLPEGWKVSEDKTQILNDKGGVFVTFPEHYSAKQLVDGKVMLVLNDTVKPTIGESTEGGNTIKPMEFATDGQKDVVKLNVPGRKSFLFYGVKSATTLSNLKGATPAWATQKGVNPPAVEKSGDAQFFKVVVTDVLPAQN